MASMAPPAEAPPEASRDEYAPIADNPFRRVADSPRVTFSADVDTASYTNVRRFIHDGDLPPASAVRIEEMLNYFRYTPTEPAAGDPIGVSTELAPCPWNPDHRLARVTLDTRALAAGQTPARNLVFLLDVSGSMGSADKLPLVQRAMGMLSSQLGPEDSVAIVVYAGASGVVLPPTPGDERATILGALAQLNAGGSTNGGEGIRRAYALARESFREGGINRVILATDGDFNVGVSSRGELERLIAEESESGVKLTVLGFGRGNLGDATMETLADRGDGNYAYIDSVAEARRVLVREAGATLVTVAEDVKLQIALNALAVTSYRLLGYENRRLATEDFANDERDAGEVGAGHQVTALLELVPREAQDATTATLRYQDSSPSAAAETDEVLHVRLRYKRPGVDESELREVALRQPEGEPAMSETFAFASAVAEFGLWLRRDDLASGVSIDALRERARAAVGQDPHGDRAEFVSLVQQAARLGQGGAHATSSAAR